MQHEETSTQEYHTGPCATSNNFCFSSELRPTASPNLHKHATEARTHWPSMQHDCDVTGEGGLAHLARTTQAVMFGLSHVLAAWQKIPQMPGLGPFTLRGLGSRFVTEMVMSLRILAHYTATTTPAHARSASWAGWASQRANLLAHFRVFELLHAGGANNPGVEREETKTAAGNNVPACRLPLN